MMRERKMYMIWDITNGTWWRNKGKSAWIEREFAERAIYNNIPVHKLELYEIVPMDCKESIDV